MVNDGFTTAYRPLDAPRRTDQLPATFVQRAGAVLLDAAVGFVCVPVPVSAFFTFSTRRFETCVRTGKSVVIDGQEVFVETCTADVANQWLSRIMFWTLLTLYVLALSWWISRRRTLGQRATGTAVVDEQHGTRIGFRRALLRTLAMAISAAPLGLGFWWALWDRRKRTWHDMIAGTKAISY